MVGAKLVEDSSIMASRAWSSESSTFFIRELGPLTKARPETRSRKHSNFICLPPTTPYRPTAGPTFPAVNRGRKEPYDKLLAQPTSLLPTLLQG